MLQILSQLFNSAHIGARAEYIRGVFIGGPELCNVAPLRCLRSQSWSKRPGFPAGVVSVITGDTESCAIPLTRHPDVDRIAFTGGPETARHVVRNSAENFAVTSLELGGKSPIVVFDDSDLNGAANGLVAGNFGASGQSCAAGSRGLIHRPILEALTERIALTVQSIVIGNPLDAATHLGPLCTKAQIDHIIAALAKAKAQGAQIRFGGAALERPGNYMAPTLVQCDRHDIETVHVELFGPVMSLIPFDTEEEAISLANSTPFGLGSGVFTQNLSRAHRVSKWLKAGICWINTYRAISPIAPFGGYNHSGYGREAGVDAIYDYTRTKTTWINTSDTPMANPFVMR
ncbi:aldehyde dehydrogenase family protein [Sulfitobacter sp.]|jgi:(Z)-2-((N-methylformamido)methylene)-5-hydroxybutyrolactone dehydrogenase|uniref:aldehyde dehydrogenase family protein n=1 Tax=Sulfitobacter sp. TaxID=1903071 RepID=UPI0026923D1E|tara:strand:- start:7838 stop:8872 length:1035 start_codon:yes stop_codon:yes gene_type:complete